MADISENHAVVSPNQIPYYMMANNTRIAFATGVIANLRIGLEGGLLVIPLLSF